ncbi:MAG: peptide deformylase [Candidatus Magasanikbacteria bacterium]|nr:peptide deformylase [Candidatus Magasanikbacteria bacterium]
MLEILTLPNEILRKRSKEIDRELALSKKIQKLIGEMIIIMKKADGVGLAAPQVGESIRLCVINGEADKTAADKDTVLINPVWKKISIKKDIMEEGCLSVPKTFGKVKRYIKIKVDALNEKGEPTSFIASDLLARVIQHEVDHLDGILFIDKAKDIYKME